MYKERIYNPKAFLTLKRNTHRGLTSRTKIVSLLEKETLDAKTLAERAGLRYASVLHHLHLLEAERIIAHRKGKPYIWELTGAGQQSLVERFFETCSK